MVSESREPPLLLRKVKSIVTIGEIAVAGEEAVVL